MVAFAYDALDASAAESLSVPSCIEGSFDVAEAEVALGTTMRDDADANALEILVELQQSGLVSAAAAAGRYELHPVVRRFVAPRVDRAAQHEAYGRLARHARRRLADAPESALVGDLLGLYVSRAEDDELLCELARDDVRYAATRANITEDVDALADIAAAAIAEIIARHGPAGRVLASSMVVRRKFAMARST